MSLRGDHHRNDHQGPAHVANASPPEPAHKAITATNRPITDGADKMSNRVIEPSHPRAPPCANPAAMPMHVGGGGGGHNHRRGGLTHRPLHRARRARHSSRIPTRLVSPPHRGHRGAWPDVLPGRRAPRSLRFASSPGQPGSSPQHWRLHVAKTGSARVHRLGSGFPMQAITGSRQPIGQMPTRCWPPRTATGCPVDWCCFDDKGHRPGLPRNAPPVSRHGCPPRRRLSYGRQHHLEHHLPSGRCPWHRLTPGGMGGVTANTSCINTDATRDDYAIAVRTPGRQNANVPFGGPENHFSQHGTPRSKFRQWLHGHRSSVTRSANTGVPAHAVNDGGTAAEQLNLLVPRAFWSRGREFRQESMAQSRSSPGTGATTTSATVEPTSPNVSRNRESGRWPRSPHRILRGAGQESKAVFRNTLSGTGRRARPDARQQATR